jgi:hypothetical protein
MNRAGRREDGQELTRSLWPFRWTRFAVHGSPDRAALYIVVKATRAPYPCPVVLYGVHNREAARRERKRERIHMGELVADLFTLLDGHARGEGAPACFGYPGPDLERWIDDRECKASGFARAFLRPGTTRGSGVGETLKDA